MAGYLLGIDIGTSACKAALFDGDGTVVAQAGEEYPTFYPQPGWVEQNPEDWWQAACRAVRRLLEGCRVPPSEIEGVGVDGQSWAAVALDREGAVLCPTPIWLDTRAAAICDQLRESHGEASLFAISGNPLQPSYTLPKILWYRQEQQEVYRRADKILQCNSFLVYRLTGAVTQDYSQGYGLGCFDIHRLEWNRELCVGLGIRPSLLPELLPSHQVCGRVTKAAAALTGLAEGTPVVAGGLDAACGSLGAGVVRAGQTQEQGGQAGGMSICLGDSIAHPKLILSCHVVPEQWLLQGGTTGGGGVLRWLRSQLCTQEEAAATKNQTAVFAEIDRTAAQIAPGSDGVTFLPYLAGERSPIWNPAAKGVFYGLDFSKTRGHFIRSAMEGVAYSLRHNLETAAQAGAEVETLRAMGGAANSGLWTQMKADVTGLPIEVPASDTATTLGAAILAGVGCGVYTGFEEAAARTIRVKRRYTPNEAAREAYDKGYRVYRRLYEQLEGLMTSGE